MMRGLDHPESSQKVLLEKNPPDVSETRVLKVPLGTLRTRVSQ